jgi:hypothetical protein
MSDTAINIAKITGIAPTINNETRTMILEDF